MEVEVAGTHATAGQTNDPESKTFSRLIRRTTTVDVIAGLGGVSLGYVLLVPRVHVGSTGELGISEVKHIYEVAWETAVRISDLYGCEIIVVEHGSSGDRTSLGGACITHAHVHLFPVPSRSAVSSFVPAGSIGVSGYTQLARLAESQDNYYFCANAPFSGHLLVNPHLASQHARRVWARLHRQPDSWDWAAFPFIDNCRSTTLDLRRDKLTEGAAGSSLAETLQAYADSADRYAERTREFPPGSSLPSEIDQFCLQTSGVILDAGAGVGRDAARMARHGRTVIALDASAALLQRIEPVDGLIPLVGDIRALPFGSDTMGGIWCSAVLLHLDPYDVLQSLREFWRVLKPSGIAQISVKGGSGHSLEPVKGGVGRRHFFYYDTSDLISYARIAGLEVLQRWTEDEIDFADTIQTWVKLLVRKCEP